MTSATFKSRLESQGYHLLSDKKVKARPIHKGRRINWAEALGGLASIGRPNIRAYSVVAMSYNATQVSWSYFFSNI